MVKKIKKPGARSGSRQKTKGTTKSQPLTKMDLAITGLFIGSIIFCVAAFATAHQPFDEYFFLWPLGIGAVGGAITGLIVYLITRYESLWFMIGIMAFSGALIAVAFVLSFNRPWDKSALRRQTLDVVFKYKQGSGKKSVYYVEVKDFDPKQLEVEETVYNQLENNGTVDLIIRDGYFGFPYLERIEAAGIVVPEDEDLPEVQPLLPVPDLPADTQTTPEGENEGADGK
ncbi:MAG: hypothetical protein JXQ27_09920 [Acidobacteria bacterium]|nr:hypothetical protein [Acidobacteriota bacterium]